MSDLIGSENASSGGVLVDFNTLRECKRFDDTLMNTATAMEITGAIGMHCNLPHALAEMYLNRALDLLPEADPSKPFATTFESDNARALYDNVEALTRLDDVLNGAGGYKQRFGAEIMRRGALRADAQEAGLIVPLVPRTQRENFAVAASLLSEMEEDIADPSYLASHYITKAITLLDYHDLKGAEAAQDIGAAAISDAPRGSRAVSSAIEVLQANIHSFQHAFGAGRVIQAFDEAAEQLQPSRNLRTAQLGLEL